MKHFKTYTNFINEAQSWNDVAKVMDKALKKAKVPVSYAKDYVKSLERMAKSTAKKFFDDYGDFTEADFIEDVEYNMANESAITEAKKLKVGDKLTLLSNGKEGKVIKVMSDMANVDFGGGDIYGIMFSRIKGDKIEESYSDEQRMKLAEKGFALSDGSYPIKDLKDLKNAIMAYGRAKDQARTAKFIVKRAKALGAEDLIPDTADFQKSIKESKAYKSASRNELAQYIINLQDEIKAYQQRGNKKYAEGSARDLAEVKAELASRK